jgi:hypothetical protein
MAMKTTEWDRIVTSSPLNKDASVARDGSGDLYDKDFPNALDERPGYAQPSAITLKDPRFINFTGKEIGRLTVLGLVSERSGQQLKGKGGARWLCRCVCGHYAKQSTKALKRATEGRRDAMCDWCEDTQRKREGRVHWSEHGLTTYELVRRRGGKIVEGAS